LSSALLWWLCAAATRMEEAEKTWRRRASCWWQTDYSSRGVGPFLSWTTRPAECQGVCVSFLLDYLLPPTDASPATLNILTAVSSVRIIAVHREGGGWGRWRRSDSCWRIKKGRIEKRTSGRNYFRGVASCAGLWVCAHVSVFVLSWLVRTWYPMAGAGFSQLHLKTAAAWVERARAVHLEKLREEEPRAKSHGMKFSMPNFQFSSKFKMNSNGRRATGNNKSRFKWFLKNCWQMIHNWPNLLRVLHNWGQ